MRTRSAIGVLLVLGMILVSGPLHAAASVHVPLSSGPPPGPHLMPGSGYVPSPYGTGVTSHGPGTVITTPSAYIDYWGSEWQSGFTYTSSGSTYTSGQVMNYINSFFGDIGGSPWLSAVTQYSNIQNPPSQLKGTWVHALSVTNFDENAIKNEAQAAYSHFGSPGTLSAVIFVVTGPGKMESDLSGFCAYHDWVSAQVIFSYLPFQPTMPNCYSNAVNSYNDSFGHGLLDGFSIVGGHEYGEALTDPLLNQWYQCDVICTDYEIGDLCEGYGHLGQPWLNGMPFAVQGLWSNAGSNCPVPSGTIPSPDPTCSNPTLAASPTSSQGTGQLVTFMATSAGCPWPYYKFWIRPPGGNWAVVQDYRAAWTYQWNAPTAPGVYSVEVDVRDKNETVSYDDVARIWNYTIGCTSATLSASPASSAMTGTTVRLTGGSSCPGTPEYRFWTRAPGGNWTIVRDYAAGNLYDWNTPGFAPGGYSLEVDVRNQGSTTVYDRVANLTYSLATATPCNKPTLTASPASPGSTGGWIQFDSTTSNCPTPVYRFWIRDLSGAWHIVQDYSTSGHFDWGTWSNPSTGLIGSFGIEVDVRDQSETVAYDAVTNITYQLNGCTWSSMYETPASPQQQGTIVTVVGYNDCPGVAMYRFWIRDLSGAWHIVQDYSTSRSFSWNTATYTQGTYGLEIDVRDQGATPGGYGFEAHSNDTFTVTYQPGH